MKSQFEDRETLGTQLLATNDEHVKSDAVEVGDLGKEMGKSYMKELFSVIDNHAKLVDRYYIQVIRTTEVYNKVIGNRRVVSLAFVARNNMPGMEPGVDVWHVDNKAGQYKLMWTLPPYESMDYILENYEKFDKDLVHWVSVYKDAEAENRKKVLQKKSKHKIRKESKKLTSRSTN